MIQLFPSKSIYNKFIYLLPKCICEYFPYNRNSRKYKNTWFCSLNNLYVDQLVVQWNDIKSSQLCRLCAKGRFWMLWWCRKMVLASYRILDIVSRSLISVLMECSSSSRFFHEFFIESWKSYVEQDIYSLPSHWVSHFYLYNSSVLLCSELSFIG